MKVKLQHWLTRLRQSVRRRMPVRSAPASLPRPGARLFELPRGISRALGRASRAAALIGAGEFLAVAVTVLFAGISVLCLVDWLVRTPQPLRLLLFVAQCAGCLGLLAAAFLRLSRNRPSDREAAFLLQRRYPELGSGAISAVEIARAHGNSVQGSAVLTERMLAALADRMGGLDASAVCSPVHLRKLATFTAVSCAVTLAWVAVFWPSSSVWLKRWMGGSITPPSATTVQAITTDTVVAKGADVLLEARALGRVPESGNVELSFEEGGVSRLPAPRSTGAGAEDRFSALVQSAQSSFSFSFRIGDGVGATHRIRVVQPPSVASCTFQEVYPAYTGLPPAEHLPGSLDFLAGSAIQVAVKSTQPASSMEIHLVGTESALPMKLSDDALSATAEFVAPPELTGIRFRIVNTEGVASVDETVFRATVRQDEPPKIELLAPGPDLESATAAATLQIAFASSDDFGLQGVELAYALGGAADIEPPPPETFTKAPLPLGEGGEGRFAWPLADTGVQAGQRLFFLLRATDNRQPQPGESDSQSRSLAIVTPEEKQLETVRRIRHAAEEIRRLGEQQLKVRDTLREAPEQQP